jgi:hypothetical protein
MLSENTGQRARRYRSTYTCQTIPRPVAHRCLDEARIALRSLRSARHIGDADDEPAIASEKFMLEMSTVIPIAADVIVAPHHGADNGSSTEFIKAVNPTHVIFSAGHKHHHPRQRVVQRYLDNGVMPENIRRTDRGDDEGGSEATLGSGTGDGSGDDDIDILMRGNGTLDVDYVTP